MSDQNQDSDSLDEFNRSMSILLGRAHRMIRKLGPYEHLLDEILDDPNDWSFIIRLQSLLKTSLNHLLSTRISVLPLYMNDVAASTLSDFITRLPMGGRIGKIRLARQLDLTSTFALDVIEQLTEIRNFYAHDVRSLNVSINQYILANKKEEQFRRAFIPTSVELDTAELNFKMVDHKDRAMCRLVIGLAVCSTLGLIDKGLKPHPTLLTGEFPAGDG